ncbi:MAG: KH domain-containing protein [Clostridia bacterium]|nr:KH domain-containing protein [Clostridia bacterium]
MCELIKFIVTQLVEDKDSVNVTLEEKEGVEVVTIKVADDDIGRVIGKQGRVAMAIRTIAKSVGIKNGKHYSIEIAD